MTERIRVKKLTVAVNATESDPVSLEDWLSPDEALVGIDIPSGFVGNSIGFKNSVDLNSYRTVLKSDGTSYALTCAADRSVQIHPADSKSFRSIKLTFDSQTGGPIDLHLIAATVA